MFRTRTHQTQDVVLDFDQFLLDNDFDAVDDFAASATCGSEIEWDEAELVLSA